MNNAFGHIPDDLLQQAQEAWDFKTCQRSDGTTYGTSGDCTQLGSKEVSKSSSKKKTSKKSSWDDSNLAGKMGTEIAKVAGGRGSTDDGWGPLGGTAPTAKPASRKEAWYEHNSPKERELAIEANRLREEALRNPGKENLARMMEALGAYNAERTRRYLESQK